MPTAKQKTPENESGAIAGLLSVERREVAARRAARLVSCILLQPPCPQLRAGSASGEGQWSTESLPQHLPRLGCGVQGRYTVPGRCFSPWMCDGCVTSALSSLLSILRKESFSLLCQGCFSALVFPVSSGFYRWQNFLKAEQLLGSSQVSLCPPKVQNLTGWEVSCTWQEQG